MIPALRRLVGVLVRLEGKGPHRVWRAAYRH